jgi:hypothetical protein
LQPESPEYSGITNVTLTADGYFTDKGIRVAFLQECAETTLKDGYDSFELLSYLVREKPGHKEASGSIKVSKGPPPAATRNTFDARKVLADKGF